MRSKFQAFDPFNSFSTDRKRFVDRDNAPPKWSDESDSDDVLQLWRLGHEAYCEIGEFKTQAEFDEDFADHLVRIKDFGDVLAEDGSHLDYRDQDGESWKPDFSQAQSIEILGVFWQIAESKDELFDRLALHYLYACLEEIDLALIGKAVGGDYLHAVIGAVRAFGNFQALATGNTELRKARSKQAMLGARERHARDPKQTEKLFVYECWKEWRLKPANYNGKAAFARDMLTKCEHLESTKVIEDWCREWENPKPSM